MQQQIVCMKKRTICHCNGVTEAEVMRILKKGAQNIGDISRLTLASTGCGRCKVEVEAIVAGYLKNKKSEPQQKLNF